MVSHEHNLLPFSTPQSYALLSAESKATEAANNKERLVVRHYVVWCRTIFRKKKRYLGYVWRLYDWVEPPRRLIPHLTVPSSTWPPKGRGGNTCFKLKYKAQSTKQ